MTTRLFTPQKKNVRKEKNYLRQKVVLHQKRTYDKEIDILTTLGINFKQNVTFVDEVGIIYIQSCLHNNLVVILHKLICNAVPQYIKMQINILKIIGKTHSI